MPSTWITHRPTADGSKRYRVMYRLGGRGSVPKYGGSFRTQREALARKSWISGELAALRVPDIGSLAHDARQAPTVDRGLQALARVTRRRG